MTCQGNDGAAERLRPNPEYRTESGFAMTQGKDNDTSVEGRLGEILGGVEVPWRRLTAGRLSKFFLSFLQRSSDEWIMPEIFTLASNPMSAKGKADRMPELSIPFFKTGGYPMTYDDFTERLAQGMQRDLGQEYPGISVQVMHVARLQGQSYDGISIHVPGKKLATTVNPREYYDQIQNGETDFTSVLRRFCRSADEVLNKTPDIDVKPIGDYNQMKQHLQIQMVPTLANLDMLSRLPHLQMADLSAVFRFVLSEDMTILVTNRMLEEYGVTESQVQRDALNNAPKEFPAQIRPLATVLAGMMGDEDMMEEMPEPDSSTLYVASIPGLSYGAGVIAYPTFMEQAAEKLGGDFFILPSSIHEVLLLKDDGKTDYRGLEAMVCEINQTQVAPEDRLSDFVYHYDTRDRIFERAGGFESRKRILVGGQHERHSVLADLENGKKEEAERQPEKTNAGRPLPSRVVSNNL